MVRNQEWRQEAVFSGAASTSDSHGGNPYLALRFHLITRLQGEAQDRSLKAAGVEID